MKIRPRRNRNLLRFVATLGFASLTLHALEPNEWRNRQTFSVERAGVVKFALPPATLDAARSNLEDLRLLDASGREIPFAVQRATPPPGLPPRAPKSFRPALSGSTTQLVIETGVTTPLTAIVLTTPAPAFLKAAKLEVSADGERWDTVQTGVPIFRQFLAQNLRIELDGRIAAHVRIVIDDTRSQPIPFTGATLVPANSAQPAVTTALPARIARRDEFAGESVLAIDLGAKQLPIAELEFLTAEPLFTRAVTVTTRELVDNATVERVLASGSIFRIAVDGAPPRAQLALRTDFVAPSRELLVHIANGDSPPLALDELRLRQRPLWLTFNATAAGPFTLLTGNPDVPPPRYDVAALAGALRDIAPASLEIGAIQLNPGYRRVDALGDTPLLGAALDPAPWRFRKPVQLAANGVQQLELDVDVLARAQPGFADLRLVRGGTQVPYLLERPALSRALPLAINPISLPQSPRLSRWEIKLPRAGVPLTRLTLTSPTPLFQRHVRVWEKIAPERGDTYELTLAAAEWTKAPGRDQSLTFTQFPTPSTDTLFVETDNGDNPPIVLSPTAAAQFPVARLLFKTDASDLALYYGNREVAAPRYDLALVATHILTAEKNPATLGPEEKAKPDGWATLALAGQRSGLLFWGALALVVVVLLVVVAKLLPKPTAPSA